MGPIEEIVTSLLEGRFPDCVLEIDSGPHEKVGGSVIWRGFEEMDDVDRMRAIREALSRVLSQEERTQVTTIFGFTPTEIEVIREEQEALE